MVGNTTVYFELVAKLFLIPSVPPLQTNNHAATSKMTDLSIHFHQFYHCQQHFLYKRKFLFCFSNSENVPKTQLACQNKNIFWSLLRRSY